MNERTQRIVSGAIGFAAVAALVGGSFAVGGIGSANEKSEPRPASVVVLDDPREAFDAPITEEDEVTAIAARKAAAAEAFRIEAERKAAEEAAARAAEKRAAEEAAARQTAVSSPSTPTSPGARNSGGGAAPAPVRCPGGTVAMSTDGVNDTSCLPAECLNGTVDPATRPDCATPFRP